MGRSTLTLFALTLAAAPCPACDIPVYRYALDHWAPDAYQIDILHKGPMDVRVEALAAALRKPNAGNYTVRLIDVSHPADDAERELCRADECTGGPRAVVRLPGAKGGVVYDESLNEDTAGALLDSPCRRRIADRLLAGDAVVWVLLQCGRKDADDAAAGRILDELERPSPDGQPPLTCPLVRVSRSDPAEKLLVETLLSTEPDLRGRDEPMAFPVFGCGRVLYALVGTGVNGDNVRHALDFLVGGCSCTIKRGNPGVDLPLAADWGPVTAAPEEAAAPTSEGDLVSLTPLPLKPARPAASVPPTGGADWRLPVAVIAAAILVLVTGWLAVRSMKARP